MTDPAILPELVVRDPEAAAAKLRQIFGFADAGPDRLRLGSQTVLLRRGHPAGHGAVDHLALAVADADLALAAALARGGVLETSVTPDGPLEIPEFWENGARYVFLEGPEGARIEFCARIGVARPGLPGHDHFGIACRDLPAMRAFFLEQGLTEVAAHRLIRAGGDIEVCFLGIGNSMVELYAPPDLGIRAAEPFWRLVLHAGGPAQEVSGPEGLVLSRRPLT